MPISVAIADDDAVFSDGVRFLLTQSGRFACVAMCASGEEALHRLPPLQPRVVLMDIQMPGMSGPECVARLKEHLPDTEIMMLTVFEEYDRVYEALAAGATGYLLKRTVPVELLGAIEDLLNGGSPMSGAIARKVVMTFRKLPDAPAEPPAHLSQREEEILHALAQGRRPKEIAADANVSVHTVRTHLQNIYKKLQVCTRREAIRKFQAQPPRAMAARI
jgi:DNA-binding NarL/FixJ family response regulator